MNPLNWPYRVQAALGLSVCLALLGYALYAQHVLYLSPCPLCILQRVAFMVMAAGFLIALIHGPRTRPWKLVYAGVVAIGAAAGVSVAGRHLYLQNLPADEVPACTSLPLDYMLETFPFRTVIDKVFNGSGECAVVDWTFLGLSMPGWTLVWYIVMGLGFVWVSVRARS